MRLPYCPPCFKEEQISFLKPFLDQFPLAILASSASDGGFPLISHLPMLVDLEKGILKGHLSRANPHWKYLSESKASARMHIFLHLFINQRNNMEK